MSIITKIKIWGLVGTAVVAATWIYLLDPLKFHGRDDFALVSVLVTFEPRVRKLPVQVVVKIGERSAINEPAHESPWQEMVDAPKGSLVTLIATQSNQSLILRCSITARGRTTGPSGIEPHSDGSSNCMVAATA